MLRFMSKSDVACVVKSLTIEKKNERIVDKFSINIIKM